MQYHSLVFDIWNNLDNFSIKMLIIRIMNEMKYEQYNNLLHFKP